MTNLEDPEALNFLNWTIVEEQILYKIYILPTSNLTKLLNSFLEFQIYTISQEKNIQTLQF